MFKDLFKGKADKKESLKEIRFIALDINYVKQKPEEIKWFYTNTHCCGMQSDDKYAYFGYLTPELLNTAYQLAKQRYSEYLSAETITDLVEEETIDYKNGKN